MGRHRSAQEPGRSPEKAASDGVEELRSLSADGNRLVIVWAMDLALFHEVARSFQETRYVILGETGAEPNVTYLWFEDDEGAFLAGAAAALKTHRDNRVRWGRRHLGRLAVEAGFEAGARAIDPDVVILSAYLTAPPDWTGFASPAAARLAAEEMYRAARTCPPRRRNLRRRCLRSCI